MKGVITYISTASLGFPALINSPSASWNFPSSSRYMACLRWISGILVFMDVRARSNAKSNALKEIKNKEISHYKGIIFEQMSDARSNALEEIKGREKSHDKGIIFEQMSVKYTYI